MNKGFNSLHEPLDNPEVHSQLAPVEICNRRLHSVFVYGSLRNQGYNHRVLHGEYQVRVEGQYRNHVEITHYAMYGKGCSFPFVAESMGSSIRAEQYAVTDEALRLMDRLEGNPSWYKRVWVKAKAKIGLDVELEREGWLYVVPITYVLGMRPVETGDWHDFGEI